VQMRLARPSLRHQLQRVQQHHHASTRWTVRRSRALSRCARFFSASVTVYMGRASLEIFLWCPESSSLLLPLAATAAAPTHAHTASICICRAEKPYSWTFTLTGVVLARWASPLHAQMPTMLDSVFCSQHCQLPPTLQPARLPSKDVPSPCHCPPR
jgi:hypothetical protein